MSMRQICKLLLKGCMATAIAVGGFAAAAEAVLAYDEPKATLETLPQDTKEPHKPPHPHKGHVRGGHIVKDTADLLGTEPRMLVEELKQGKSLLQVVQARKGWSEAEYVQKLTVIVTKHIDEAAAEGRLSKEKAEIMKTELPVKLKKIVNRTWNRPSKGHPVTEHRNNTILWHTAE